METAYNVVGITPIGLEGYEGLSGGQTSRIAALDPYSIPSELHTPQSISKSSAGSKAGRNASFFGKVKAKLAESRREGALSAVVPQPGPATRLATIRL
jgi:hypothetical protein